MPEAKGAVTGDGAGQAVTFFGLSTCVWCKKTRAFLEGQNVPFEFFYLDLLESPEREQVMAELARHNPGRNFPTVVVGDEVVVGYDEEGLRRALGL